MSHEIRTPMNAILGFTELLEDELTDSMQIEYLSSISNAGTNLLHLIDEILDLSKIEAGKLDLQYSAVKPEQIFSKTVKDKDLQFRIIYDPVLPDTICIDGDRLRQILINLIGNALKFTEKGYIELGAKLISQKHPDKITVKIWVRDTGRGIAPDQQQVIFQSFRQHSGQDSNQYGGTGLGLTISKRLTNLMTGEISVESEVNKGTTFSLLFNDLVVILAPLKENNSVNYQQFSLESSKNTSRENGLTPEALNSLSDFILEYEKSLYIWFNEVRETLFVSDIHDFAVAMGDMAPKYNLDFLVEWSDNCINGQTVLM